VTAPGKKTTTGLSAGDRILITNDPARASTRTPGDWHPSRVKTGATTATVLGKQALAGRRTRYNVVTDVGVVPDVSGGQTFLLALASQQTHPGVPVLDNGTDAAVMLPHTGLRAPHARLTVRNLRHWSVGSRVAYEAVLYLDDQPVGKVTNPKGTDTWFEPHAGSPFGEADLRAFVALCRDEDGNEVTVDDVLNELIDEQQTAAAVRSWLAKFRTPVRLLMPIRPLGCGHGHVKGVPAGIGAPADRDWWGAIVRRLHRKRPLREGEVFQIWTGTAWEDLPSISEVTSVEPDGGAQ
jgi:hypothetical protein